MDKGIEKHDTVRPKKVRKAHGKPGKKPTWSSGAKTLVGTAASARSRIWFTIGNGTLNEIYFPDVDQANTRSVRFLLTDGETFFSDEEWDAEHKVEWLAPGIPGARVESRCRKGRYILTKEIVTDPVRDTLLMRATFQQTSPGPQLKLFLFVEPQMGDRGYGNQAWAADYKGVTMLLARRDRTCLAVVTEPQMLQGSCGYVGTSDGQTALAQFKQLPDANFCEKGNVALTAELDWQAAKGELAIALACGSDPAEAAQQARAGILEHFDTTREAFLRGWQKKQDDYANIEDLSGSTLNMYRVSTAVLETHQSKRFPGAFIASLSMPWGFDRSDKDVGGYHVLWPRDLVETAMGKLASGDARSARSSLFYLSCTQDADGSWSQNMWLDGTMHWGAIQMDGMALPILLADKLRQEDALDGYDPWPMVRRAAAFLLKNGPVTQQGRWEATGGYSVYTIATEIAALLAAADFAERAGDASGATFLRSTADAWYDAIDELTYAASTPMAEKFGVSGYYMRITPPEIMEAKEVGHLRIKMPNLPVGMRRQRAIDILSPDALALVRFGLRRADDPRILGTIRILDATLKRETSTGPVWVRSTKDGYGEHADGSPFLKTGIGRGWPLLAGERAHYEIAAGNRDYALELLRTMARQTSEAGMIPEQIWDAPDIPERFLFNGHPTGSGMPLVWAHSEYIKLLRSLHAGAIWDLPIQTVERYLKHETTCGFQIWTPKQRRGWVQRGKDIRIDLSYRAKICWTSGSGKHCLDTSEAGFGMHSVIVPASGFPSGSLLGFEISSTGEEKTATDAFQIRVR